MISHRPRPRRRALAAAALLTALSAPCALALGAESAEYTFRWPLVNGRGVQSLADLAGRPVLIDFWGTR